MVIPFVVPAISQLSCQKRQMPLTVKKISVHNRPDIDVIFQRSRNNLKSVKLFSYSQDTFWLDIEMLTIKTD